MKRKKFKYDVFIAYARADAEWATRLAAGLRNRKVRCRKIDVAGDWLLEGSVDWQTELALLRESSWAGLVILTPHSVASPEVSHEISVLSERARVGHPFIPVLREDCDVPERVGWFQWIDCRDSSPLTFDQQLDAVTTAIQRPRFRPSLTETLLGVAGLVLIPLLLLFIRNRLPSGLGDLKPLQEEVQRMDMMVQQQVLAAPGAPERTYFDPRTGEHIATDVWADGVLVFRMFYRDGVVIARDQLVTIPNQSFRGKERAYQNRDREVFLYDTFRADGWLHAKLHCPNGTRSTCIRKWDHMHSPILYPWALPYR